MHAPFPPYFVYSGCNLNRKVEKRLLFVWSDKCCAWYRDGCNNADVCPDCCKVQHRHAGTHLCSPKCFTFQTGTLLSKSIGLQLRPCQLLPRNCCAVFQKSKRTQPTAANLKVSRDSFNSQDYCFGEGINNRLLLKMRRDLLLASRTSLAENSAKGSGCNERSDQGNWITTAAQPAEPSGPAGPSHSNATLSSAVIPAPPPLPPILHQAIVHTRRRFSSSQDDGSDHQSESTSLSDTHDEPAAEPCVPPNTDERPVERCAPPKPARSEAAARNANFHTSDAQTQARCAGMVSGVPSTSVVQTDQRDAAVCTDTALKSDIGISTDHAPTFQRNEDRPKRVVFREVAVSTEDEPPPVTPRPVGNDQILSLNASTKPPGNDQFQLTPTAWFPPIVPDQRKTPKNDLPVLASGPVTCVTINYDADNTTVLKPAQYRPYQWNERPLRSPAKAPVVSQRAAKPDYEIIYVVEDKERVPMIERQLDESSGNARGAPHSGSSAQLKPPSRFDFEFPIYAGVSGSSAKATPRPTSGRGAPSSSATSPLSLGNSAGTACDSPFSPVFSDTSKDDTEVRVPNIYI